MTETARRNLWTTPRLGGMLTGTVVVLVATACWLIFADGDNSYQPMVIGAWTVTVAYWTIFFARMIRRRRNS